MRKYLVLFLVLCAALIAADEKRPTICLNMIVKNETKVIKRCLESCKPLIDYWVIVDTGSKDGTQEMIKEFMKDIPGELHERPWVNFAHNRNEALELARSKGDYLLFIDADDTFSYAPSFQKPLLNKDSYYIKIKYGGTSYDRIQLIKSNQDWKWAGVVHEVLVSDTYHEAGILDGVTMVIVGGGDRSHDPKKFLKDAALLENAVREDPSCGRHVFYLAQSYRDAGAMSKTASDKANPALLELALKTYEKRVEIGGWDQEVFFSLYQIALIQEELNYPEEVVVKSYVKAFTYRPSRAEPLYRLSQYYRKKENYLLGYLTSLYGLKIKESNDSLFVDSWMYDYGLLLEHSISAYWIGKYDESWGSCVQLLAKNDLPQNVRECTEKNLNFALAKLREKAIQENMIIGETEPLPLQNFQQDPVPIPFKLIPVWPTGNWPEEPPPKS